MGGTGDEDAVADAIAELYALDRDQFVAARDAAAAALRKAGDKMAAAAVKKLGRPTVAAWAINQLVRANPDLTQDLATLGVRLRDAQATLDAAELKALRPDRDELLERAVHAAGTVAAARGQALGAAADEVRGTFVAALADPAAADAVTSGRLVRALSYAGFGEVELDDAVAALPAAQPPTGRAPTADPTPGQAEASKRSAEPAQPDDETDQKPGSDPGPEPAAKSRAKQQPRADQADQAARERAEAREREAERDRAASAAAEAEQALRDAERQVTAAELAAVHARDKGEAARRRTEEIRTLLAAAERDERAAADQADAAATEADEASARVAEATHAWQAATAARDALPD
jgi:hypothetical protein